MKIKNRINTKVTVMEVHYQCFPTVIDKPDKKVSKEISELNQTCKSMELMFIVFHLTTSEYTLFSAGHRLFSKIDHILVHRTCTCKCKQIKTVPFMLSNHSTEKLEIDGKRNCKNCINIWKLTNTLLNKPMVKLKNKLSNIYK